MALLLCSSPTPSAVLCCNVSLSVAWGEAWQGELEGVTDATDRLHPLIAWALPLHDLHAAQVLMVEVVASHHNSTTGRQTQQQATA